MLDPLEKIWLYVGKMEFSGPNGSSYLGHGIQTTDKENIGMTVSREAAELIVQVHNMLVIAGDQKPVKLGDSK